jgi:hypothetical protein
MNVRDVIARLVQPGWTIRTEDHGGFDGRDYWLEKREGERLTDQDISDLLRDGWVRSYNGGYELTDEGRKAYFRSSDELGDGQLIAPRATATKRESP